MKPGKSTNRSNPLSDGGVGDAAAVGRMSSQTSETCQCGSGPDRMVPPRQKPYPGGVADIDGNEVEEDQTSNVTQSTRKNYSERKKVFGM